MSMAKHLTRINKSASGPGAIRIPNSVSYIRLELRESSRFCRNGHLGATRFWRSHLPQIQFHNPELAIAVKQLKPSSKEPAQLILEMQDGSKKTIDVGDKKSLDIIAELMNNTEATKVPQSEIPILKEPQPHDTA